MIEDVGYEVIRECRDVVIKIGGMMCVMCVKIVENVIREFLGVFDVSVNFVIESVRVFYNLVFVIDRKSVV